jgi:ATP:ADP antiporter, AAA family
VRALAVRHDERRDVGAAFSLLLVFIASHTMLETARDALFLAKVPATRLPWVFLGIAAVSLGFAHAQARLGAGLQGRLALSVWTAFAAIVTFSFWALLRTLGAAGLYALYVWSGVLTTLVLVHFWTLLGTLFTVTQAKRIYGVIGAGSVVGAIAGSGLASGLARAVPARHLLLASAIGFAITSALPLLFTPGGAPRAATEDVTAGVLAHARWIARQPYARGVVVLILLSTTCVTVSDYLFKSTVAEMVPRAQLGAYLATVYFVLNILSLAAQLGMVSFLVRRIGLTPSLAVLPALLFFGGLGMAATGGLVAALAIKTADGSLRYSLHRTATELLFLPLGEEARGRTKSFVDVVGQRGGQALASVGIIALAASGAPRPVLAGVLVVLAAAWFASAVLLRGPYIEIFRTRLRTSRFHSSDENPELDVASLETLVGALDSEIDNEVLAALHVLEREGKARLIPALILYHPSEAVVIRALTIFMRAKGRNVTPVLERLVEHPSPRVRAATMAARSVLDPDPQRLLLRLAFEESAEVRAAIVVNLIASGEIFGADARERIEGFLRTGSAATKVALAEAIGARGVTAFNDVLTALARTPGPEVRLAALRAIGSVKPEECLPVVIERLGEEATRAEAQRVLLAFGDVAFSALAAALDDAKQKTQLRGRIPEALSLFEPEPAAKVLLARLAVEHQGSVRFQILRALERVVNREPAISLDRALLERTIADTVSRSYRYIDRRVILARGKRAEAARDTEGERLLERLLHDKEGHAIERLFRLLVLAHPTEDFLDIYRGLRSGKKDERATSVELVENILRDPLRKAVLGLIDDIPDPDRLASAGQYHALLGVGYDELLAHMLASTSESVQDLTVFHIGELRLVKFKETLVGMGTAERSDVLRTLAILGGGTEAAAAC